MSSDPTNERVLDLLAEWEEHRQNGRTMRPEDLCPDNESLQHLLAQRIEQHLRFTSFIDSARGSSPSSRELLENAEQPSARSRLESSSGEIPTQIDRYRVIRRLGQGGFGKVYLAHDDQLDRAVAIKIPHRRLVTGAADIEPFLAEARNVAKLDHPHIVSVYDTGVSTEFGCFVVSRYVEGSDLSEVIRSQSTEPVAAAKLISKVADALHHAHLHGLVHRDVKPQNILVSQHGDPFVVDFGMALREQSPGQGRRFVGTPAYMSPEQAQGESHRVDGRSDVFSLGLVLYELLTGRKAFAGSSHSEVLRQVTADEPKPLRQIKDTIPKELERICLRAISKRASERQTTARDLADELQQFVEEFEAGVESKERNLPAVATSSGIDSIQDTSRLKSHADSEPGRSHVVPKGLRSFDGQDATFFVELLPGPRDWRGLPECLRFWMHRIEPTDAGQAFSIGLIYGPSGCGKSSLVKAGLLPLLSDDVQPIYLEATSNDTEQRLLSELRKHDLATTPESTLKQVLAAIRAGVLHTSASRTLIIIDQFEQWLHVHQGRTDSELVQALRECDGNRLQCIVMVRDDFWLATTRFFADVEVPLIPGHNSALVDLFDIRHAENVLIAFGVALNRLPARLSEMTVEQFEFIRQAVNGLAEDGRIICVRLALFAELMKWKPWAPGSLSEVGGHAGLGVTFLEESFATRSAQPAHRTHADAARRILSSMLPASESDIQRYSRTRSELATASGYSGKPQLLDTVLSILDRDLRLITVVDGSVSGDDSQGSRDVSNKETSYRLTHEYLIPALREWLLRKQKETRRGRAELLLADRASLWKTRRDARFLPTLSETASILAWTRSSRWSAIERQLIRSAAVRHLLVYGSLIGLSVSIVLLFNAIKTRELRNRVHNAVESVLTCRSESVQDHLAALEDLPPEMIEHELIAATEDGEASQTLRQIFVQSALKHSNSIQLCSSIATAPLDELENIRFLLEKDRSESIAVLGNLSEQYENQANWVAKARVAITALMMNEPTIAIEMSQIANRPDPVQRSVLIEAISCWPSDLSHLASIAKTVEDSSLQSALCLGLTGVPIERVRSEDKLAWTPIFSDWYLNSPSSVVHSGAGLPLLYWGLTFPQQLQPSEPSSEKDWFINSLMMTMVRIPASAKGPAKGGDGSRDGNRLSNSFYLEDRELNVGLMLAFINDPACPSSEKPRELPGSGEPNLLHPAHDMSCDDCVLFCNWLSRREMRTPAYERIEVVGESSAGDWRRVEGSNGYRLPTADEWQYACRAGTTTNLPYGLPQLTSRYANVESSALQPIAMRLPNGWGLFDMLGNVGERCDLDGTTTPMMGGTARSLGSEVSSETSVKHRAESRSPFIGLRVMLPVEDDDESHR